MYDADAIRRAIGKMGMNGFIEYLSGELNENFREELTRAHLLVNGYPNVSFIMSLV